MDNKEILGKAIMDCHRGELVNPFTIHYRNHTPDLMPIEVFFREFEDMPVVEQHALSLVRGTVLDVGAGAGAHSLHLQSMDYKVTALDFSGHCCDVMKERGVQTVVQEDIFDLEPQEFDTVLLLMNGIGLAGSLDNLPRTLRHLLKLIKTDGQVLFDSSDLSYLKGRGSDSEGYVGHIDSSFEYEGNRGEFSSWLYVDPYRLIEICNREAINLEIILEDDTGLYLARIYH